MKSRGPASAASLPAYPGQRGTLKHLRPTSWYSSNRGSRTGRTVSAGVLASRSTLLLHEDAYAFRASVRMVWATSRREG
jgi:hypothetical protein